MITTDAALPPPWQCETAMCPDLYTADQVRACVAHATAAKDAEIEALRAEVDEWKRRGEAYFQTAERQGKSSERLAEALREIEQHALARGNGDLLQFVRAALLRHTATQENDNA